MKNPPIHERVVCAAAAVLMTGLSSMVFVSAEPRSLESRGAPTTMRTPNVDPTKVERGRYIVEFPAG